MSLPSIQPPSERKFGLLFGAIFFLTSIWAWWSAAPGWAQFWLGLAAITLLLALAAPRLLSVPNRAWFKFGMLLNAIVSPIVLGAIFFVLIAPIAIGMRLVKRDALNRRYDRGLASYWVERKPPGPPPGSFKNQF
jgi:hypothetical protein